MYQDTIYWLSGLTKFTSGEQTKGILVQPNQELACQDSLKLSLNTEPTISNIQLEMKGCILFKASVNALCLAIEHKSKREALEILNNYLNMIQTKDFNSELLNNHLKLFEKFKLALSRRNCLTIGALELKKELIKN